MNAFELSRNFWDWAFENPELVSPGHAAVYFFAIEHCNRLGGKEKFGFPSQMTMDAVGIKKHQTYIKYFNDLVELGFFSLIQRSTNQYSANIISLPYAMLKNGKALDKAFIKHGAKQTEPIGQSTGQSSSQSTRQSKDSIIKPINNKQLNKETKKQGTASFLNQKTKDLADVICEYFSISEQQNFKQYKDCCRMIDVHGEEKVRIQFLGYVDYKKISEEKTHSFKNWIGEGPDFDTTRNDQAAGWNERDWDLAALKLKSKNSTSGRAGETKKKTFGQLT